MNNNSLNYWKMQLHPDSPEHSVYYAYQCLMLGYIGLGFSKDLGNLTHLTAQCLEGLGDGDKLRAKYIKEMAVGDKVLIVAHHYPVALATVASDYLYINDDKTLDTLGIWFQHCRRVENLVYYADIYTNPTQWQECFTRKTLEKLIDKNTLSWQVIEELRQYELDK